MSTNPLSPDVLMDADGDLPLFTRHASGMEIIAQRVRVRLGTHRGDWPLDVTAGIPWTEYLGRKPVDMEALAAVLALEILAVPGVLQVEDLSWTQDGGDATVTATVRTTLGESLPVVVTPHGIDGNPSVTVGGVLGHARRIIQ